ncbi:hypothetical protein GCM10009745_68740 [Kribbella yunnanensis]|uniref:DUF4274 domain-containing protein n=2 Tax=Kribbella yunnanensis TaxID=190194 RepID=A0ABN2ISL3_9ACTN
MPDADVVRAFGHLGSSNADQVDRAALVAALLSSFTPDDAPLIRELTRQEIAAVGDADEGCGDVLLACCWLLFMIGHVEDAVLVWRAKNTNFDARCYIDSVFLIPQGAAATAEFARSRDLIDLADWVEGEWLGDMEDSTREWRSGSFFERVPPAAASVEDLAAWMRQ